jgi:hypothetical protein
MNVVLIYLLYSIFCFTWHSQYRCVYYRMTCKKMMWGSPATLVWNWAQVVFACVTRLRSITSCLATCQASSSASQERGRGDCTGGGAVYGQHQHYRFFANEYRVEILNKPQRFSFEKTKFCLQIITVKHSLFLFKESIPPTISSMKNLHFPKLKLVDVKISTQYCYFNILNETVSRDFRPQFFFINRWPLEPW